MTRAITNRPWLVFLGLCFILPSLKENASADVRQQRDATGPSLSEPAVAALAAPPAALLETVRRELEASWRRVAEPALAEALASPDADISTRLLPSVLEGKPYLRFFAAGYAPETGRKAVVEVFHGAGPEGVEHQYGKWFRPIELAGQSIEPLEFIADRAVVSTLTDDLTTAIYWQTGALYAEVRAPERSDVQALAQRAHGVFERFGIYRFPEHTVPPGPELAVREASGSGGAGAGRRRETEASGTGASEASLAEQITQTEPNDDRVQATPIAVGERVRGKIEPRNDADWYRFEVDRQGALEVAVERMPDNLDVTFQVFDSTGGLVQYWVPTQSAGQAIAHVVDLRTPGIYYLEVRDGGNNASSPEPYDLVLAFSPTADEREPNDEKNVASPIPIGKTIEANILPRDDADWYWLSTGRQGALRIAVPRVPPELDVTFQVFDGAGQLIQYWVQPQGPGQGIEHVVDLLMRGTYYLEVRDAGNNARSAEPYALALGFTATADDGEPNDNRATAAPIIIGETVQANILPIKDGDWYRLEVAKQGELEVRLYEVPAELDLTFQLFDAGGKPLQTWVPTVGTGKDLAHAVRLPAAGPYYIEVRDGGNNARSSEPYSLSIAFRSQTGNE